MNTYGQQERERPVGICFNCGKLTYGRFYVQDLKLPFCDFKCRNTWVKLERAESRSGRLRKHPMKP
jgi:hypothetical protein